jgi:hypothetical protein
MSILVVCQSCHKRFKVSDKYAGQSGKCPSCKGMIKVPTLEEQVTVHEADYSEGAKDSKGENILKPIEREESEISNRMVWITVGVIAALVLITWILGFIWDGSSPDKQVPVWLLSIGAVVFAPPLVFAGYQVLRDQEKGYYQGRPLLNRVLICSVVYAMLWIVFWQIPMDWRPDMWAWLYMAPPILFAGTFCCYCTFGIDFSSSFFHYCFYLVPTILLRVVIGLPAVG